MPIKRARSEIISSVLDPEKPKGNWLSLGAAQEMRLTPRLPVANAVRVVDWAPPLSSPREKKRYRRKTKKDVGGPVRLHYEVHCSCHLCAPHSARQVPRDSPGRSSWHGKRVQPQLGKIRRESVKGEGVHRTTGTGILFCFCAVVCSGGVGCVCVCIRWRTFIQTVIHSRTAPYTWRISGRSFAV